MTHAGDIDLRRIPLKVRPRTADRGVVPPEEGDDTVQRYRRLVASLGWLAAFVMAAGAGWKSW
jgi:hypothetical protein